MNFGQIGQHRRAFVKVTNSLHVVATALPLRSSLTLGPILDSIYPQQFGNQVVPHYKRRWLDRTQVVRFLFVAIRTARARRVFFTAWTLLNIRESPSHVVLVKLDLQQVVVLLLSDHGMWGADTAHVCQGGALHAIEALHWNDTIEHRQALEPQGLPAQTQFPLDSRHMLRFPEVFSARISLPNYQGPSGRP